MSKPLRILIVEDTEKDTLILLDELKRSGYEPTYERVDTPAAMQAALEEQTWDVVMSDYALPHFSAPAALTMLKERGLDTPFLIVSGAAGEEVVAAAMNAGAHDFIWVGDLVRLIPAMERELRAARGRAARRLVEAALRETESKYRTLVGQIPAGMHIMALAEDGGALTVSVNPQFERMLGFSLAEWMADPDLWRRQLHPDDRERVLAEAACLYTPGAEPFVSEYRMLTREGGVMWLRDETVVVRDHAGQPQFLQSIRLDITARKRAEAELHTASEKLENWVKELEQHNREITLLNELGTQLHTCLTVEEAYTAIADYAQLLFPAEAGALHAMSASRTSLELVTAWGDFPQGGGYVFAPDECWGLRRGRMHVVEDPRFGQVCQHLGDSVSTSCLCVPLMAQGEALGLLHLQKRVYPAGPRAHTAREPLTESKQRLALTVAELIALALANLKLRETLRIQSSRDPLTNLFNRRYLEETLERELRRADRKERPLGIILLDLDDFERFNDAFGHDAGDALLREAGRFLQKHIRGEDVAGRYNGEEFLLILPEASREVSQQRAEKLQEAFTQLTLEHRGQSLKSVTVSAGVAVFPEHGATVQAILQAAETALYRAKEEAPRSAARVPALRPDTNGDGESEAFSAEAEGEAAKPREALTQLTVGALSLNYQTFELTVDGKMVSPTPVEYELLRFLMSHAGKAFVAERLLQEVWHYPPGTGSPELVRAHIKNLRSKVEPNPRHPIYLKTIGRFGYTIALAANQRPA